MILMFISISGHHQWFFHIICLDLSLKLTLQPSEWLVPYQLHLQQWLFWTFIFFVVNSGHMSWPCYIYTFVGIKPTLFTNSLVFIESPLKVLWDQRDHLGLTLLLFLVFVSFSGGGLTTQGSIRTIFPFILSLDNGCLCDSFTPGLVIILLMSDKKWLENVSQN